MKKIYFLFLIGLLVSSLVPTVTQAKTLSEKLSGMILLQVEENGEAWYVRPNDKTRYYMKNGSVAYQMMREFSLGITNDNLNLIPFVNDTQEMKSSSSACLTNTLANQLKGEILLQVENNGEAWYVDPTKCRRIYMKNGAVAYEIMRFLGLGITNSNLQTISIKSIDENTNNSTTQTSTVPTQNDCPAGTIKRDDSCISYLKACQISHGEGCSSKSYLARDPETAGTNMKLICECTDGTAWVDNLDDSGDYYLWESLTNYLQNNNNTNLVVTPQTDTNSTTTQPTNTPVITPNNNSPFITSTDQANLKNLINNAPKVNKQLKLEDVYGVVHTISLDIPLDYYLYYKNKKHDLGQNFSNLTAFVTPDDYYIDLLTDKIYELQQQLLQQGKFIIGATDKVVQHSYYSPDWHTGYDEYPKYPIETIFEGNGDCEDLAFLMASLDENIRRNNKGWIKDTDYRVALLRFPGHLAVGFTYDSEDTFNYANNAMIQYSGVGLSYVEYNGYKYVYKEATNPDFLTGQMPADLIGQPAYVYELSN